MNVCSAKATIDALPAHATPRDTDRARRAVRSGSGRAGARQRRMHGASDTSGARHLVAAFRRIIDATAHWHGTCRSINHIVSGEI